MVMKVILYGVHICPIGISGTIEIQMNSHSFLQCAAEASFLL